MKTLTGSSRCRRTSPPFHHQLKKGNPMLILARNTHQSIEIGSDIIVKVLAVRGTQVRLGIKAPKHIPVHRQEVARRIRGERSAERP
jgi:carbon storage regulator